MTLITDEIKNFIKEQKLCFVATVSPDNTPNVSPKGTLTVWDDSHLIFADIKSPHTIENLRKNPSIEINVVNPIIRKGFRFKGEGTILTDGEDFQKMMTRFKDEGVKSEIQSVVLVKLSQVKEVSSPLYDLGYTEEEIKTKWKKYYLSL